MTRKPNPHDDAEPGKWTRRDRKKRKRQPVHGLGVRAILNAIVKRAKRG